MAAAVAAAAPVEINEVRSLRLLLTSSVCCLAADQTTQLSPIHESGHLPFTLQIEQTNAGTAPLPTLHSYTAAVSGGDWLFLGGRTNGLHGMTGHTAFPEASANADIWVVDLHGGRSWHRPLSEAGLSSSVVDFLSSTNQNACQDGNLLYVAGGYGWSVSAGDYVTFSRFARIDIAGLKS